MKFIDNYYFIKDISYYDKNKNYCGWCRFGMNFNISNENFEFNPDKHNILLGTDIVKSL